MASPGRGELFVRHQQDVGRVDREAELAQPVERRRVVVRSSAGEGGFVGGQAQRDRRHFAALDAAHRAGGEVARIGVRLLGVRVEAGERRQRQKYLAANRHLQRLGEAQRHRTNRAHVGGHGIAYRSVAARHRPFQHAAAVVQDDRRTVDLFLHGKADRAAGGGRALVHPGAHLGGAVRFVQAQHRHGVRYLRQVLAQVRAHALARRVGLPQPGVVGFQAPQFVEQPVVGGVAYRRLCQHVILVLVAMQQYGQLCMPVTMRGVHGNGHSVPSNSRLQAIHDGRAVARRRPGMVASAACLSDSRKLLNTTMRFRCWIWRACWSSGAG